MSTKEQDQELSETIQIWEGIEGNSQLIVWLKELQRHRQAGNQRADLLAALERIVPCYSALLADCNLKHDDAISQAIQAISRGKA